MSNQENKKEKSILQKKIINETSIKIYSLIIAALAMLMFELGYCNNELLINVIMKTGNPVQYNFSLCRIIVYVLIFVIYMLVNKKFINPALEVAENKYKRVFIYIVSIMTILITVIAIAICIKNPLLFRGMTIGILATLMSNLFIIYVSNDSIKNVIVTLSTLGILVSIVTNFNHAIDEKKHFMSAFNVSFLNFDFENKPITDKQIEELPQLSKFTTIDKFLRERYIPEITDELNMEDVPSTPANYSAILYIPSAIGMAIARLTGGSIIDMYILGRIFNLIAYGILVCIALKILPYKKNVFSVLFLMPMMIALAGTYSIDGMCMGLVSIFIAYCLKIYDTSETINIKQFCILLGLFIAMLLAKSMAYIFVALIVFMLPLKKTILKNKKYIPIMAITCFVALVIFALLFLNIRNNRLGADTRWGGNINPEEQIQFILHNPLADIEIAINHFKDTLLSFNWYSMLHYDVFFAKDAKCVMLALMLFILYVAILDDTHNFKLKDKIILILSFIMVWGITSAPLYITITEVGSLHIGGYQARYIMPILPLMLMCISSERLKSKENKNRNMNIAITSGVFVLIGLLQAIIV